MVVLVFIYLLRSEDVKESELNSRSGNGTVTIDVLEAKDPQTRLTSPVPDSRVTETVDGTSQFRKKDGDRKGEYINKHRQKEKVSRITKKN